MGRFLDRLKNFGSKILGGIRSISEKVMPVVRKLAPHAAGILKNLPIPGAPLIGEALQPAIEKIDYVMGNNS